VLPRRRRDATAQQDDGSYFWMTPREQHGLVHAAARAGCPYPFTIDARLRRQPGKGCIDVTWPFLVDDRWALLERRESLTIALPEAAVIHGDRVGRRERSILRDIREAKRMAAVVADVLGVALPARQETNAVGGEEAEERVANPGGMVLLFQEAVTAVARVLDEPVSHGHGVDAMAEQPTGVSDLLGEALAMSKPVRTGRKNQRVTAPDADVLVHPVAIGETNIGMVAQETGERVPNVGSGSILAQILSAAAASPGSAGRPPEHLVVDDVPPQSAAETDQRSKRQPGLSGDRLSFHRLLYTS
jgi:hypothetical protein